MHAYALPRLSTQMPRRRQRQDSRTRAVRCCIACRRLSLLAPGQGHSSHGWWWWRAARGCKPRAQRWSTCRRCAGWGGGACVRSIANNNTLLLSAPRAAADPHEAPTVNARRRHRSMHARYAIACAALPPAWLASWSIAAPFAGSQSHVWHTILWQQAWCRWLTSGASCGRERRSYCSCSNTVWLGVPRYRC